MSAFIVNAYHINALVSFGVATRAQYFTPGTTIGKAWTYFTDETAADIAATLYSENVRSVNYRYSERTRRTGHVFKRVDVSHLSPADVVRACDCLDYQSCETKDWQRTAAYRALQAIRERAISQMIEGSTVWGLSEPADA